MKNSTIRYIGKLAIGLLLASYTVDLIITTFSVRLDAPINLAVHLIIGRVVIELLTWPEDYIDSDDDEDGNDATPIQIEKTLKHEKNILPTIPLTYRLFSSICR